MVWRGWLVGLLCLAGACAILPPTAQAQNSHENATQDWSQADNIDPFEDEIEPRVVVPVDDARLDRALAALEGDDTLQTERPEWTPEPVTFRPRGERSWLIDAIAGFFRLLGPVVGYMLIALIALMIAFALYSVFGESFTLRRREKVAKSGPVVSHIDDLRPDETAARALLEDADALAAAGRFAEAVHMLLFRSIDDIQSRREGGVPRSLTAREIGRLDSLPARVRGALAPIIQIVERSFFGGRPVDASGWQTARASYQDFAFGEAWT